MEPLNRGTLKMKRYFKREVDPDLGPRMAYLEFDGEWATRQIEFYPEQIVCSDDQRGYQEDLGPALTDQPLSRLGLGPEHEITREEFENVWNEALHQRSLRLRQLTLLCFPQPGSGIGWGSRVDWRSAGRYPAMPPNVLRKHLPGALLTDLRDSLSHKP